MSATCRTKWAVSSRLKCLSSSKWKDSRGQLPTSKLNERKARRRVSPSTEYLYYYRIVSAYDYFYLTNGLGSTLKVKDALKFILPDL
jgi:hypothetical protein